MVGTYISNCVSCPYFEWEEGRDGVQGGCCKPDGVAVNCFGGVNDEN